MAEEIVGVKIQVDASDMNKSVGDLRKKIIETEAEVKRLEQAYGEQSKEAIEGQKRLAQLQDITNKKIEQQNQRIDDAAKTVSALSAAYGGVQGALELTGLAGEDTIKQLAKIQSALAIGDAVQNLAEFKGAIKNTFSTFATSIKSTFSTLRSGLIATGIGAFVVALGLVAANFETVKKVVLNFIPGLGKVADYIGNLVNKVTDFVGITSEAGRATAKLLKENDKAIKDSERFLELNGDKYDEYTQRKIKANLEYKKKVTEFNNDEQLSELQKNAFIKQAREKANREIAKADSDRFEATKKVKKAELTEEQKENIQREKDFKEGQELIRREKELAANLTKTEILGVTAAGKDALIATQVTAQGVTNAILVSATEQADAKKKLTDYEKKLEEEKFNAQLGLASQSLSIIGGLVDQNSAAGKAIAVTQAIINTYQGASKAIAQGGIFGPVAAAATIAAGLVNVKKIISTKVPSAKGTGNVAEAGAPSMSMASAPISPSAPIQNTVTSLSQQSINQMGSATGRAYVVESDITNQQEKIIRINRAARLG